MRRNKNNGHRAWMIMAVAGACASAATLRANDIRWTNASGGNLNVAGNWQGTLPGPRDVSHMQAVLGGETNCSQEEA